MPDNEHLNPTVVDSITCSYCGEKHPNTNEAICLHILLCEKRPELGLLLKIDILERTGDVLLRAIHGLVEVLSKVEGMRSKSWEIYHEANRYWNEAKESSASDLAIEARREEMYNVDDTTIFKDDNVS